MSRLADRSLLGGLLGLLGLLALLRIFSGLGLDTLHLLNHEGADDSKLVRRGLAYLSLTSPDVSFPPYARLTERLLTLRRLKAVGLTAATPWWPEPLVFLTM